MKRVAAVLSLVVFVLVILSATVGASSAKVSPIPTDTAALQSPLSPPAQEHYDPYYVEHPRKVTPRPVPYVNEYGETIIREEVIEYPHREADIIRYKAVPETQPRAQIPDTFNSPVGTPYTYTTYLPVMMKNYVENAAVMAIVYQGEAPWYDPAQTIYSLTNWIRAGTSWHGYTITGSGPAIGFYLTDSQVHFVYAYPPTQTANHGYLDLNAIYNQFNICSRIAAGEIDEVWIMADGKPHGHVYSDREYTINAQSWSNYGSMPTPYCGRQIYTMLLNFDAVPVNAFESWVHSMEKAMMLYVSGGYEVCDFTPLQTYGLTANQSLCTGSHAYSNLYAYTTRPDPVNGNVGMCGDAHMGANVPSSILDYDPSRNPPWLYIWDSPASALNRCNDWQWGNVTASQTITCAVWGCNQNGWQIYYLQNMPGLNNNSHGRSGALRPNWWLFRMPQ
jgi:hypothetical protein